MNKKSKGKKLKAIIHRFRNSNSREMAHNKIYNHDADISFMSATYDDVKKLGVNHELNRIRRHVIESKLNKYQHPSSDHRQLKGYRETGKWLNWIGIVADISMPTSNSLDGKILIDKFCYENDIHQLKLLDYHVWLKINEIRYLLNSDQQTIAVGDTIRGISKVTQYSSKGLSNKYGLAATLLKGAGIYVSIPTKRRPTNSSAEQFIIDYDRQDDWVAKLSNSGVPKRTLLDYQKKRDINIFVARSKGHVSAKYQPSRYKHYFERLEPVPKQISQNEKKQREIPTQYFGIVDKFKVFQKKDGCHTVIQFAYITDEIKRIVSGNKCFEYDGEILALGSLKPKDVIGFKDNRDLIKSSGTLAPLTNVKLLTNHDSQPMPTDQNLISGWVIKNFGQQSNVHNQNDLVNKFDRWLKNQKKDNKMIDIGFSTAEIAEKTTVNREQVKRYLDQNKLQPLFSQGKTDYYSTEAMNKVIEHFKQVDDRIKSALQAIKSHKPRTEYPENRKKVQQMVHKDKVMDNDANETSDKSEKSNNQHTLKINTTYGRFTTSQFKDLHEAYNELQRAIHSGLLNYFIKAKDENDNEYLISIKNIVNMS